MASTFFQIASTPLPSDEPVRNYSASTDIPAYTLVQLDTTNSMGGAIGQDDVGVVASPTSAALMPYGVTVSDCPASGESGRVRTQGRCVAIADSAINLGDIVGPPATTAGRVATATSGKSIGQCVGVASGGTTAAAGDQILVSLFRNPY